MNTKTNLDDNMCLFAVDINVDIHPILILVLLRLLLVLRYEFLDANIHKVAVQNPTSESCTGP